MPPMTSLDHLIVGVPSLERGVAWLERGTGVRAAVGGRHPQWGTHNALASLGGGAYLELIARDPAAAAPARLPFGLAAVEEDPRLIGWAVRTADVDTAVAAARALGHDPGDPVTMHRRTADGELVSWRLTSNASEGGPVPFLIDWGATRHPSEGAPAGLRLVHVVATHPDPGALRARLAALGVGVEVVAAEAAGLNAEIEGPSGLLVLGGPPGPSGGR